MLRNDFVGRTARIGDQSCVWKVGCATTRRVQQAQLDLVTARIPIEVAAAVLGDQLVEMRPGGVHRCAVLTPLDGVCRHELQSDLGHDPEGAETDAGCPQHPGIVLPEFDDLAAAGHQATADQKARQIVEIPATAMGARGDDAGNGLRGNVTQVGEVQTNPRQIAP
jgi:hypothetical protein